MSDNMTNAAANAAAPKPKRPRPLSMIMLGRQTDALFENARLAKERGEKVGWSASRRRSWVATIGRNGNTCQLSLQHAFGRSYRASSQFFSITYYTH